MSTNPVSGGLAIVTGASSGIGYELACCCTQKGFDLLFAADEPAIEDAALQLRAIGVQLDALQVDLSTTEGVDRLYEAVGSRKVEALLANAGRGLGLGFLDQDFDQARGVIDTNITGTVYLIHKVGRDMRTQGEGRILITGGRSRASSLAAFKPSTTAPKPSSTPSLSPCVTKSRTAASPCAC